METNVDRYAIYRMKGRNVRTRLLDRRRVRGRVKEVHRDIMRDRVRLRIGTEQLELDEPDLILETDEGVVFVYGDPDEVEATDAELFGRLREVAHAGGTIDDALEDTRCHALRRVAFTFEDRAG